MEENLDGKVTQNQQKGLFVCLFTFTLFSPFFGGGDVVVDVVIVVFSLGRESPPNPSTAYTSEMIFPSL